MTDREQSVEGRIAEIKREHANPNPSEVFMGGEPSRATPSNWKRAWEHEEWLLERLEGKCES